MQDYVDGSDGIFNRLAAIKSEIEEHLKVYMLLASLGDKNRSAFGHQIASLQILQKNLTGKRQQLCCYWSIMANCCALKQQESLLRVMTLLVSSQLVSCGITEVKHRIAERSVRHTSRKSADAMLVINPVKLLTITSKRMGYHVRSLLQTILMLLLRQIWENRKRKNC